MTGATVSGQAYKYPLSACDVQDKQELERFRTKRDEWVHWLRGDPHHAINTQIHSMMWSDAVFRLINESRGLAQGSGGSYATLSGILARAVDRGYVAEQLIAIRRLVEPPATKASRQVISLRRLLDDVRTHRGLLSREMYVCHDGLPFEEGCDPELAQQLSEQRGGFVRLAIDGPTAYLSADLVHDEFDRMMDCAPQPGERTRSDPVGDRFFDEMENTL